jgi:hypothetical protein
MQRESVIYLVAAGLFAAAAGVNVGMGNGFDLAAVLLLGAAIAFAALAMRKKSAD